MFPRWVHLVERLKDHRSRATRFTRLCWASVRVVAVAVATVTAPTVALCDDGLLTLNLTVRMPDGSPAAGAIVESSHQYRELDQTARTD